MKNLVLIFLFITGFCYAQIPLNEPTPYEVCDDLVLDGVAIFDLVSKNAEILGSLSPTEYTVTYHETLADSETGAYPQNSPYANIINFIQQLYVRVTENANPNNYGLTILQLIVNSPPIAPSSVPNLIVYENSSDGFANFNLNLRSSYIIDGQNNMSVSYFNSLNDATNNFQPIVNSSNYTNTANPQTIYSRIENVVTGCYSVTSFQIEVQEGIAINNPTPLEVCDNDQNGFFNFDLLLKNAEILGALSPIEYAISYHETFTDAQLGSSPINTSFPYNNVVPNSQNAWVRVEEIANPSNFATTSLQLIVNLPPTVPATISDLIVYENPYDGSAVFDLTVKDNEITTSPSFVVSYHTSLSAAQNNTNPIVNEPTYVGSHLQTIYARVLNPATGCTNTTSFVLKVYDSSLIVYIPDANFKAKLISLGVDTNSDGEIQFGEAESQTTLDISFSNINDSTGIEAFINLTSLNCSYNSIPTLNLNTLTNLTFLDCSSNLLSTLDFTNNTNLTHLSIVSNFITSVTGLNLLVNLTNLDCYGNHLTSVDISNLINLNIVTLNSNNLSSIDLSNNINITQLRISQNLLTSIDVSALENLLYLNCGNNQITSLNLSNNTNLIQLDCYSNQLTNLDVSNLNNLQVIDCRFNQLTSLSLAGTDVFVLKCSSNPLTNINLEGTVGNNSIGELYCNNTNLSSIDLTNTTENTIVECNNNASLQSIFMKNGVLQQNISFSGNPNLDFICVDDGLEVDFIRGWANSYGYTNCVINSYCSFTPGGDFNTISGNMTFDSNNNGCDLSDPTYPNIRININDGVNSGATFANATGNYTFYTGTGDFTLSPELENPTWFTVSPTSATINFPNINNNLATQNFCISPNGTHQDLEIVVASITPARPGFQATYEIVYKNKGNTVLPAIANGLNLEYDSNKMVLISASEPITGTGSSSVNFGYEELHPFETKTITVVFLINSPTATNPVNIGDQLTFSAQISPLNNDENSADNLFILNQTVVGSYDPNDITCIEGDELPTSEIGKYLHYMVNFENTGNYAAENVVAKIDIDAAKYDINTLQVLHTSHPSYTRISGNKVEFIFEGINLEAVGGNPPVGGHGNVLFKIKSKATLNNGDTVAKRANIFFDYNAPINTNIATTTYQTLSNSVFETDESITIYPNPTNDNININSKFNIKTIELYDMQGRILETIVQDSASSTLDISNRKNGIYFLKINTENGSKVEKIVKE